MNPRAQYIWIDDHGEGRNRYVLFRRSFVLTSPPRSASLKLFADTRYRLLVNGQVVGHGPARFFTEFPLYDTYDVLPYLREGQNALAVVVHSYGTGSFHSEPSIGGLIADLSIETDPGGVSIPTDGRWRALESAAYRRDTHTLSFALNSAEHVDLAGDPPGWDAADFTDEQWPAAVVHGRPDRWGTIRPRPIPALEERVIASEKPVRVWSATPCDEQVYSLGVVAPGADAFGSSHAVAVWSHLHSPRAQRVEFTGWWGYHWVNGRPLSPGSKDDARRRQNFVVELNEGWNTLFVFEPAARDWWDFYVALPAAAGLTLRAAPALDAPGVFLVGGPWPEAEAEVPAQTLPWLTPDVLPAEMASPRIVDGHADWPIREHAWRDYTPVENSEAVPTGGGTQTRVYLYDFGRAVLGRPRLEFVALKDTRVDLGYTERLLPDGRADLHGRFFVDLMERAVARDGRQVWHTFHPRGFRYLEVAVTGNLEAFELLVLHVTSATYPVEGAGSFSCSDPQLTRLWAIGRDALHACMEDAYLDCPTRERGVYSGDALVEYEVHRACDHDDALMRRTLELFLQGMGENGLIRPSAHGRKPGDHIDYTPILVLCLKRYVEVSGDDGFLVEHRGRLERLCVGLESLRSGDTEFFDAEGRQVYIDISRHHSRDVGVSCAFNAFMMKGFADASWLFARLGDGRLAERYRAQARRTRAAIRQGFWDAEHGCYVDALPGEADFRKPSVPANALSVLYGVAEGDQVASVADWLSDALADNFLGRPVPPARDALRVNAYFSYYALGALYRAGRADEALAFMSRCWKPMLDAGATTTWESFGGDPGGSLCHAWGASPTYYLSAQVLGVGFPDPADSSRVRIAPRPGSLTWARGVWPHPRGPIRVGWRFEGDQLKVEATGPEGVELILPGSDAAGAAGNSAAP